MMNDVLKEGKDRAKWRLRNMIENNEKNHPLLSSYYVSGVLLSS